MKRPYKKSHPVVLFFIPILIISISCNNDAHNKNREKSPVLIYTNTVFDSLKKISSQQRSAAEKNIDSSLQKNIRPLDRIMALLLKRTYKEYTNETDSIYHYYGMIDSIIDISKIKLADYPVPYIEYGLGEITLYDKKGNFDSAKSQLLHLEEYSKANNNVYSYVIDNYFAKFYYLRREPQKAGFYSEKAFAAQPLKTVSDTLSHLHNRIAIIALQTTGQNDTMHINAIEKIVSLMRLKYVGIKIYNRYLERNLIDDESLLISLKGDIPRSVAILEEQFIKDKLQHNELAANSYNLALSYDNLRNNEKAKKYYLITIELAQKEKDNLRLLNTYDNYIDVLYRFGNLKEINKYLELSRILSKQIYSEQKEKAITGLERDYTLKIKVKENETLIKENQHKAAALKSRTTLFFAIGALLLLFIIFLYYVSEQNILKKQLEKTKIEQQLFRLQMNPHFMFNAIAGIRGNILNDEKEEAVNYLSKFSKLLRIQLENNNKEWISIESEVEFITNYLSIQQLRYSGKFDYTIRIDDNIDKENTLIPSMILQPFIENSIEHGFSNINYRGTIAINIRLISDNTIAVIIQDNGTGLTGTLKNGGNNQKSKSMALEIVKKRLDIIGKETKTNTFFKMKNNNGVVVELVTGFIGSNT